MTQDIYVPKQASRTVLWLASVLMVAGNSDLAAQGFDCVVEPSMELELGSSVSGLIDTILVERGQTVAKGDIVARLRSETEEARLTQARTRAESDAQIRAQEAALALAMARSARIEQLKERSVVTAAQVEEAEAELSTAQMNVRLAELQQQLEQMALVEAQVSLDLRKIISPITGVVTDRNLGPGEYVSQDQYILSVAQIDPLYVRALLPVDVYRSTQEGMAVQVSIDLPEPQVLSAKITVVDKVLNAAAGTFGIRAELNNPDAAIPAGQTCRLTLGSS